MIKKIAEGEAREIASRYLAERYVGASSDVVVTSVRELDIGWLVGYQSKKYLDTRDDTYALIGNGPLVIDCAGEVHSTGTSLPTSEYIDAIRKELKK